MSDCRFYDFDFDDETKTVIAEATAVISKIRTPMFFINSEVTREDLKLRLNNIVD